MSEILIPLAVIILLIAANGIFVAAEFAIAGVPRPAIDRRAAAGERVAQVVRRVLRNPQNLDRYIATAQLGITASSLGLGMYGEHAVAEGIYQLFGAGTIGWLGSHAMATVIAIAILTYFHIVLGEMVPKALALQQPERAVLWITPPMLWLRAALYPFVVGLNGVGTAILRLFGVHREWGAEQYHTSDELQYIVQESVAGGLLEAGSAQMLSELFEFGERTASELMVPRVRMVGIPLGATGEEAAEIIRSSGHTRYPVFDGDLDHIVGMLHIKDLVRRSDPELPLRREDVRPAPFMPETSGVEAVLQRMRMERTQLIVVLDEHGGTAGMLTIEDLFEEVVGELHEGRPARPDMYIDRAGDLHALGTVRLEEVGEQFGLQLEHEDVETVSGLVLAMLGRPPRVAEQVTWEGLQFTVSSVAGNGVGECVVTAVDPERTALLKTSGLARNR
jgi:CBS domain containing-hemolysin-like protein